MFTVGEKSAVSKAIKDPVFTYRIMCAYYLTACWLIFISFFCHLQIFFKINFFKEFFQEHCQSRDNSGAQIRCPFLREFHRIELKKQHFPIHLPYKKDHDF